MVDYIQEDVDSMNKELVHWKKEAMKYHELFIQESKATDQLLLPLETQLSKLESSIVEQVVCLY
jgi:hypothetical protein